MNVTGNRGVIGLLVSGALPPAVAKPLAAIAPTPKAAKLALVACA